MQTTCVCLLEGRPAGPPDKRGPGGAGTEDTSPEDTAEVPMVTGDLRRVTENRGAPVPPASLDVRCTHLSD